MIRRLVRSMFGLGAACALAALVCAAPAFAGQPVRLRADLSSGPEITLGDLFENAGGAGLVVIGYGAPTGQSAVLDPASVQRLAGLHGLEWRNPNGLLRILVRSGPPKAAADTIQALTYMRAMMAGEVVQPQDIGYTKIDAFTLPPDAPRDPDAVIGMTAARPVRAGAPVASHDLTRTQVIKRDDIVEVTYSADGISLVLQAKAMAAAAVGEPLAVMNTASKKIIQAVAVGPDQAVVGPEAERMRAAAPAAFVTSRFAALP